MKKIIFTLFLAVLIVTQVFAETGTVWIGYENGTVSYNATQTFYEFDVTAYVATGDGLNIFENGMIYVDYNTTIFGSNVVANGKLVSATFTGPLSGVDAALDPLYTKPNNGADTFDNTFAITFTAADDFLSGKYGSNNYISTSSGSPSTIMHIILEVSASGTSNVVWSAVPASVSIYHELANSSEYDGLSIANATETTAIVYSSTGDPALPITLKQFSAQYVDAGVALSWVTESEVQNLGFVLKRAIKYSDDDFSDYEMIASYQTNDELYGAGTTTEQNTYTYTDKNIKPGINYSYILEDVDYDGNIVAHDPVSIVIPENLLFENKDFSLGSTYPNPFNPSFTIPFQLTRAMDVSINMYDITGKQVMSIVNGTFEARQYQFRVNASDLNSGIYFLRAIIGSEVITQKMTLLK